jgi:Gas vesicle protein
VTPGSAITARAGAGAGVATTGTASGREIALIDLLDRLLQGGITIHGQVILSVADIDLVELDLRVLVAAVDKLAGR